MYDVQSEVDTRGIGIDSVGIAGLRYPITFDDGRLRQSGIADTAVSVALQEDRRGTHMSRMVLLVHEHLGSFDPRNIPQMLKAGVYELDAPSITVSVSFPVSVPVTAPATGIESWSVHDVAFEGRLDGNGVRVTTSVTTEVTSLCPCSKKISEYGAHNQRSRVTLSVTGDGDRPYPHRISDAVALLASCASAPIVPLVKRPDERELTMRAYDHPVFVEDMVRTVSAACRKLNLRHRVSVRNLESIHSHDAVAVVEG